MKLLLILFCGFYIHLGFTQDGEDYEIPPTEEELFYEGDQINPEIFQDQQREEDYSEEQGYYPLENFPEAQEDGELLNLGENPQEDAVD